jgi:DNA repair protein RAD50
MSMIDKLQILGVRSFDNKKAEIIQFYKPLTLIVGANGSGKTTIIECLRYATTGELPPNSATSGAWIHDTKLAGESEVLAQVRLSFNSADGSRMVVNRSLQVVVKKTTRSQKALDATLLKIKNGERTIMSSRVAELDRSIPDYLGVSKPILESVIFCHQDESLWPMSTPAMLKKKFDEIFDAQKYTKAVDNIKLIKKNLQVEEKVLVEKEKSAKKDKDRGNDVEALMTRLSAEIEILRSQEQVLQGQIDAAQESSARAYNEAAQVNIIVSELSGKRYAAQGTMNIIKSLEPNMRKMSDSDQALREMLEQYEDRLLRNEHDKDDFTKKYHEQAQLLQQSRDKLGTKQSELGSLRGQKERYEQQVSNRKELIKDTARRHNIRGFDLDISDEHVVDFMEKIGRLEREQRNIFDRARKETYEETHSAQQELSTLNGRRSELTQTKSGANAYMQQNDSKIARYQQEFNKIEVDEGSRSVLDSNVRDLESRLSRGKQEFAKSDHLAKIQAAEADMWSLEMEKEKIDLELVEASRYAKESARLDLLHKDFKDKREGLSTVMGAHSQRIEATLNVTWEPATLDQVYQSVLAEKTSTVKETELQRDGVVREADQVKFKLSEVKNALQRKEKEFDSHEQAIRDITEADGFRPQDYMQVLDQAEADVEEARTGNSQSTAMLEFWRESKVFLEEKNKCSTCVRPFEQGDPAKVKFVQRLDKYINKAAGEAQDDVLQAKQDRLQQIKNVRPRYDAWCSLNTELPQLRAENKALQTHLDASNAQLEQRDQHVKACEEARREVEAISKTIQGIVKYHNEITATEAQIKQLSALQQNIRSSRGLEQIQDDQKTIADRLKVAAASLQQLRTAKDHAQGDITTLEFQVRDVQAQLNAAVTELREKSQLQNQIEDLKAQNAEQRSIIRNADQELQALVPKVAQAQAKLEEIRARGDDRDRTLQKEAAKLTDSVNQLKIAAQEINAYIDRRGSQSLDRAEREISSTTEEISCIEEEQRSIAVQIKKLDTELSTHADTKRAINDNLTYREKVKTLETLEQEISELESHNAEEDVLRLEKEAKQWQDERLRLTSKQAQIIGEMKSKDVQLGELDKEYKTEYDGALERWRRQKIELVVAKAAIGDLTRYGGALDQAIMKYHSLKMEEINRIIDELWRNTYQGTDVDTIMIRSESETQNKNKSYNYRVVMIKQDAEMDMRGRCSAGQKVLASIIIRLALAECFGVRCGLIALDEPTTNLDRDNIIALAQSLSEIIKHRRQQSNFQLIVITHDEEFLKSMNCADYTDYYYKVGRDANMCSQIYKQNIQNVSTLITGDEWKITHFD